MEVALLHDVKPSFISTHPAKEEAEETGAVVATSEVIKVRSRDSDQPCATLRNLFGSIGLGNWLDQS